MPTKKETPPELPLSPEVTDAQRALRRWRWKEARKVGFSFAEADLFADSHADIGLLRKLNDQGCPPALIFEILN